MSTALEDISLSILAHPEPSIEATARRATIAFRFIFGGLRLSWSGSLMPQTATKCERNDCDNAENNTFSPRSNMAS
jgi:hypothetical protein